MTIDEKSFCFLSNLVDRTIGLKMPPEKKQLMETRLAGRIRDLKLQSFSEYCEYLKRGDHKSKKEMVVFHNCISTNKTDFFREINHFSFIRENVLPGYQKSGKNNIKIWSCASSSGEELYSLGMEFEEYSDKNKLKIHYSILGTDISTRVLKKAKDAEYSESNVDTIPFPTFKKKYFTPVDTEKKNYRVNSSLREKITLGTFNLMSSSFNVPGPFDIIFCRNVLIYFERNKQIHIVENLIRKLNPGGYLFLGHSESMAGMNFHLKSCAPAVFKKS